jgi:hypothetical protein
MKRKALYLGARLCRPSLGLHNNSINGTKVPVCRPGRILISSLLVAIISISSQLPSLGQSSIAPQAISDSTAYRFVLLSLCLPDSPTATDVLKRDLRFKRIPLSTPDKEALKALLINFNHEYSQWKSLLPAVSGPAVFGSSTLIPQRDDIVQRYRTSIGQTLTPAGEPALMQYVMSEKAKMRP